VLTIRRDVLALGWTKEYDLAHVSNLRVAPGTWNPYDWTGAMQFWGISGGPVASSTARERFGSLRRWTKQKPDRS